MFLRCEPRKVFSFLRFLLFPPARNVVEYEDGISNAIYENSDNEISAEKELGNIEYSIGEIFVIFVVHRLFNGFLFFFRSLVNEKGKMLIMR